MACSDFKVSGTTATIVVSNGVGSQLNAVSLTLTDAVGGAIHNCAAAGNATIIADGNMLEYTCTGLNGGTTNLTVGTKYKGTLTFGYMQEGSTMAHTKVGALTAKVE